MRSASIAEWIVSRFTSRSRAASVVGDLVEVKPHKGVFWFWASLAGIILSLTWRSFVALMVAFYAAAWAFAGFQMLLYGIHAQHRPPVSWMPAFAILGGSGSLLWMLLMYAVIRYGVQDRSAQLTLVWVCLVTAVICFWWQPIALSLCIALSICAVSISVAKKENRWAVSTLLGATTAGFGCALLSMFLAGRYQHFIYPGLMGDKEMREHPSIGWMSFCLLLTTTWITTATYARMHRWQAKSKAIDMELGQRFS
jgi:hypothetical protein